MPPRDLRYNERAGRYQDYGKRGRPFVSRAEVRGALDAAIDENGRAMQELARRFQRRELSIKGFELAMRDRIKAGEIWAAQSARGGAAFMSPADYGRAGRQIRFSYERLNAWLRDVRAGRAPVDGRFIQRALLYSEHTRVSAALATRAELARHGFDRVRSVLRPAEHCESTDGKAGCVEQAAKGWQSFAEYVPLGSRRCGVRDRCGEQYQNSQTGEVAA